MKAPDSKVARFALFYACECVSFFVIAANFRALAFSLYGWTAVTDGFLVALNMVIAKLMFEDERARDWLAVAAFTLGGMTGSVLSIYVTKHLWGT